LFINLFFDLLFLGLMQPKN